MLAAHVRQVHDDGALRAAGGGRLIDGDVVPQPRNLARLARGIIAAAAVAATVVVTAVIVVTVNIDNGFGACYVAVLINRQTEKSE